MSGWAILSGFPFVSWLTERDTWHKLSFVQIQALLDLAKIPTQQTKEATDECEDQGSSCQSVLRACYHLWLNGSRYEELDWESFQKIRCSSGASQVDDNIFVCCPSAERETLQDRLPSHPFVQWLLDIDGLEHLSQDNLRTLFRSPEAPQNVYGTSERCQNPSICQSIMMPCEQIWQNKKPQNWSDFSNNFSCDVDNREPADIAICCPSF